MINITDMENQFGIVITHDVLIISNAHLLSKLVVDMEIGQRGFIITQKEEFLEPYYDGSEEFDRIITEEKLLVADIPDQVARLKRIEQLVEEWKTNVATPEITMARKVRKHNIDASYLQSVLGKGVGKGLMDKIRSVLSEMNDNFRIEGNKDRQILAIAIEKDMVDMETGQRGFLLTGEESFLEPYRAGEKQLKIDFSKLRNILSDDQTNLKLLDEALSISNDWIIMAATPEIDARIQMNKNSETMKDVSSLIEAGTGENILDQLREEFAQFIQIEEDLTTFRHNSATEAASTTRTLTIGVVLISILIGIIIATLIKRSILLQVGGEPFEIVLLSEEVASGNLDVDIGEGTGILGSIKVMLDSLKQNRDHLQELITVRTEELGESEEKYRSLVENASVGIYILQDNKFKYINKTFEKILGYEIEELSSDSFNFMDLVAPESKEFISQRSSSREKGEKTKVNYVFKAISKTGIIIDLETNTSGVEYDGKPAIQGVLKDVTAQMKDRREKLELQEKLKQSERMESFGLLAGGVAHDLNNIIGPILAYPDLIRMDYAEGRSIDQDLDTITASAQRAADVIADLMALTRRGKYEMEPIDLNKLVNIYLSSAECKSIRDLYPEVLLDIQLSESTLFFKGSEAHLPKVIMNLINNAFESMSEEGVISISTSSIIIEDGELSDKRVTKGRYQLLTIEDQGEGIPEENISKIFDPFFTTKIKTGKSGTGLGLSVVYNVLKDHGALIDVESKLGIGSKFSLYFTETIDKKETSEKDKQLQKGSGSILIVDDRAEQRDIATRLLTRLGYNVECVECGQDAIKYLRKNDVDIVLLDMILEDEMDGLDTYEEIIKIKPDQKTIVVSGYSESERVKKAELLGVKGFIQKPYKLKEIGLTIQDVLGGNYSS